MNYVNNMRILSSALACLISVSVFGQGNLVEFEHNGITRHYILHVPEKLPPQSPLVFNLHGGLVTAIQTQSFSQMDILANQESFAVCYPQGLSIYDEFDGPMWNANLNFTPDVELDDSGFLAALAIHLQEQHNLSAECTYACGWSTGAFMCFTLACEYPDVFHAIGSLSGSMSGYDWGNCNTSNHTPIVQISGMQDILMPYTGVGPNDPVFYGGPGIEELVDFWTTDMNECMSFYSTPSFGQQYEFDIYSDCSNGTEVWEYRVLDGGHDWFGAWGSDAVNVTGVFWDFFKYIWQNQSFVYGCADLTACNFDPNANINNGSCVFPDSFSSDLDGSGEVGAADILLFLSEYGVICEIEDTLNDCIADFDGSGEVGSADLLLFLSEFGITCE